MHQSGKGKSKLVRASTLSSDFIRDNLDVLNTAVDLTVSENLSQMSDSWSEDELRDGRRLVNIKIESNSLPQLKVKAEPVHPGSFNKDDLVISCIRWSEKNLDVVTSVDILVVLEHIVGQTLSVEEKSRIRRNLQFLKPFTISKTGADRKRLFDAIMAMDNPKPRNIEKNLKVFKWTDLFVAVSKVLSKYSPNPTFPPKGTVAQEPSPPSTGSSHEPSEYPVPRDEEAPRGKRYPLRDARPLCIVGKQHQPVSTAQTSSCSQELQWTKSSFSSQRPKVPRGEAGPFREGTESFPPTRDFPGAGSFRFATGSFRSGGTGSFRSGGIECM